MLLLLATCLLTNSLAASTGDVGNSPPLGETSDSPEGGDSSEKLVSSLGQEEELLDPDENHLRRKRSVDSASKEYDRYRDSSRRPSRRRSRSSTNGQWRYQGRNYNERNYYPDTSSSQNRGWAHNSRNSNQDQGTFERFDEKNDFKEDKDDPEEDGWYMDSMDSMEGNGDWEESIVGMEEAFVEDEMPEMNMEKTTFFSDVLKYQPMTEEDFKIKAKFEGETDVNEITNYKVQLNEKLQEFKCLKECSPFDPQFLTETNEIVEILKTLQPINGANVENKAQNLALILGGLQDKMGRAFFQKVMYGATIQREDTKDIKLPENALELDSGSLTPSSEGGGDYQNFQRFQFNRNNDDITDDDFVRFSPVKGTTEAQLDYWRECLSLHNFHSIWHNINTGRFPVNRQSERFKYMHQQIMNRYRIERDTMNMPQVQPLSLRQMLFRRFPSFYGNIRFQPTFNPTRRFCKMNSTQVQTLITIKNQNTSIAALGASMENYFNLIENGIHGLGHVQISRDCVTGIDKTKGFMGQPGASARDPLFYRWHGEVESYLQIFHRNKPYTFNELQPAPGIVMAGVRLQSRCGRKNNFQNYFTIVGTLNASNPDPLLGKTLQTDSFNITIRIRNTLGTTNVIVRIFLFAEKYYQRGQYFIELDRWVQTLTGAPFETIFRSSEANSLTYRRGKPSCAWPYDLYIPRGGSKKPNRYRLVALVHNLTATNVNEGINPNHKPFMFCGSDKQTTIFDGRNFGFPFDKDWSFVSKANVIDNKDRRFGSVGQRITIEFTGKKPKCGVIDPAVLVPLTAASSKGLNVCTKVRNRKCVFPFVYKGVIYNSCTVKDSVDLWCALETYPTGQVKIRSHCIDCSATGVFNQVRDLRNVFPRRNVPFSPTPAPGPLPPSG